MVACNIVGEGSPVNLVAYQLFNSLQFVHVFTGDQCDRHSGSVGTGRTPHPVYIILGIRWDIEIDHQVYILDIYTTAHHVCGHQHPGATRTEA